VLLDVAERIKECVRQIDTVARLGGDEFVVLVNQADDNARGDRVAADGGVEAAVHAGGISFTVTASVGISLFPNDGANLDSCAALGRGDARGQARRPRRLFASTGRARRMPTCARARACSSTTRCPALAQGRLRLHYQPQIDLRNGRIVGAEA